MKSDITLPGC